MEVHMRKATYQDHGGIKELSKGIYGRTDILMHNFPAWLNSDEWFLFVGEIHEGKIIAFMAVELTDGRESLNIRSSRVDKDYRGRGIYKTLCSYALRYVRERCLDVKLIYRIRYANVRVPDGYDIIKKMGLVKSFCDVKVCKEEIDDSQWKVGSVTWPKFRKLHERNEGVRSLFDHGILEIHCDIFRLNCKANWAVLEERMNTSILLTECVDRDSGSKAVVSFLCMGIYFTNEGTPMIAMNIYGLSKEAIKCHIVKGVLEAIEHSSSGRVLFVLWMERQIMSECVVTLKQLSGCDIERHVEMNVLVGDLNSSLEDIQN